MIDRRLASLLLFLSHVLLVSSVNATSIQGVAVSTTSTGTPSVQSILAGLSLPGGPTQAVAQSINTSVTQPANTSVTQAANTSVTQAANTSATQTASVSVPATSESQDIAELKRRADESDQKIVRLTATTQDLKDASDQMKVSISQISNQQNAASQASSVTQTSAVTQTSTSSALPSTQSAGASQPVGMAGIAGVLGVNPAPNQSITTSATSVASNNTSSVSNIMGIPSVTSAAPTQSAGVGGGTLPAQAPSPVGVAAAGVSPARRIRGAT